MGTYYVVTAVRKKVPIILKVYLDNQCSRSIDVPITPDTTCRDVIDCCKEPGEEQCHLAELWRECERPVTDTERPYEILQQWGIHRDEVRFFVRHEPVPASHRGRRPGRRRNGVRETAPGEPRLPSGVDLTITELQEMAARQQQQIEAQQQILVAKEQRLKFLKQQEMKHEQIVSENERLRTLREKVEAQELKLKKLRALRGQVDQHKQSNSNLTSELESIKALFNEKEKELSIAVAKVDELTGQLDHIRQSNAKGGMLGDNNNRSVSSLEVERLRRELLIRNKLNEQQSTKIISQKDKLTNKKEEIGSVDKRIEELTSRLRKKRAQQTHQQNVQNKAAQYASQNKGGKGSNIATVEPYVKHVPQEVKDDMFSKADVGGFKPNKNDPKYQTLPANIKLPLGSENKSETVVYTQQSKPKDSDQRLGNIKQHGRPDTGNGHKIGHNFMSYGPRPYGSSYSGTTTNTGSGKDGGIRGQPEGLTSSAQNSPTIQEGSKMFTSTPVTPETSTSGSQQPPPYSTATPTGVTNSRPAYSSVPNEQHPSVSNLAPGQGLRPAAPFYQGNTSSAPSPITQSGTQQSAINLAPSSVPNQQPRPFMAYGRQSHDTQPTEAPPSSHAAAPSGGSKIADVPGTTAGGAKHTYRYAPKSVIANTYMKKLGQSTLDQYRQNMMQLYKDFYPKSTNIGGPSRTEPEQPASPTAKVRPMNFEKQSNMQQKEGTLNASTNSTSQPPPYPSVPAYEGNPDNKVQRRSKSTSDEVAPVNQAPVPETSTSFIDDPREQGGVDKYSYPPYAPPIASEAPPTPQSEPEPENKTQGVFLKKRTNLKKENSKRSLIKRRVSFDPLALLLDASLEGELELVQKAASQVKDVSQPNDEGITALHNAICAGHYEIVTFLVEFGCDVNSPDSDGWTPLHCAASCNNLPMVKFLVEHGACIFAATISDQETAAEKCEEDEDGYDGCSEYLYSVQEKLGILNGGAVFAVFDYKAQNNDELNFKLSDKLIVLRKGDETEKEWWWTKKKDREGYIPRNLIGLYPRVEPASKPST